MGASVGGTKAPTLLQLRARTSESGHTGLERSDQGTNHGWGQRTTICPSILVAVCSYNHTWIRARCRQRKNGEVKRAEGKGQERVDDNAARRVSSHVPGSNRTTGRGSSGHAISGFVDADLPMNMRRLSSPLRPLAPSPPAVFAPAKKNRPPEDGAHPSLLRRASQGLCDAGRKQGCAP
jgi:hypothetical protein